MTLDKIMDMIKPVSKEEEALAKQRWSSIAKPLGSLGLLEDAVVRMAAMRSAERVEIKRPCVVVMCADNGVVAEGISQTTQDVTAVVTKNLTLGDTSVCKMAQVAGVRVVPVDVGVASDVQGEGLIVKKVAYGTQNMAQGPAMTREQTLAAIEAGISVVYTLAGQGCDLFATGEMGIGNTTTSSALTAVLLRKSVPDVTGRGAGLSTEGVKRKVAAIRRAITTNAPNPEDIIDTLSKVGGLDIAGLVGVFLGGAAFRRPVLIDGFISSVAALCAVRLCPDAAGYILPSHASNEPAGKMLLEELKLKPFISCEMCLGEGTGAIAAVPVLKMACAVYNEMSTFQQIAIEEYKPLV